MTCLLSAVALLVVALAHPASAQEATGRLGFAGDQPYLELPAVPAQNLLRIFKVTEQNFRGAPRTERNWAPFLTSLGLDFSGGSFALYFREAGVAAVANTQEQMDLLISSVCCP